MESLETNPLVFCQVDFAGFVLSFLPVSAGNFFQFRHGQSQCYF